MSNTETPRSPTENWNSADAYEPYVGRWSRLVAREFLAWLNVPRESRWLDIGCGTGALGQTILELTEPAAVLCIDPSEQFIAHAQKHVAGARVRFETGDARSIPVADGTFDAVVSGLMLNFVPAPEQPQAASEMRRAARPGGTVAAYVWDYAGKMELMRYFWDAAVALDPASEQVDEGPRFPICQPGPLESLFRDIGLIDVEVRSIDVPTVFRDFDDYWTPFLAGMAPAPAYAKSLSEDRRNALRDRIHAHLPVRPDGSIHLTARAWAVRGTVPSPLHDRVNTV
jgi:SAM-dependent methyltransferase